MSILCYELTDISEWPGLPYHDLPVRWGTGVQGPGVKYRFGATPSELLVEWIADTGSGVLRTSADKSGKGKSGKGKSGKGKSRKGEFIERLWEHDVCELFIAGSSGTYQELNFSFDGAWWSAGFAGYRVRDPAFVRPRHVTCEFASTKTTRTLTATLRRNELWAAHTSPAHLRVNVCAILSTQQGASEIRHYYSAAELHCAAPDFHRMQDVLPVVISTC